MPLQQVVQGVLLVQLAQNGVLGRAWDGQRGLVAGERLLQDRAAALLLVKRAVKKQFPGRLALTVPGGCSSTWCRAVLRRCRVPRRDLPGSAQPWEGNSGKPFYALFPTTS